MTKPLSLVIFGALLASCQGGLLQDGSARSSQQSADKGKAETETGANGGEQPDTDGTAPIAITPVPIGGAYLTCDMAANSKTEASCLAEGGPGQPYAFATTAAYVMYGSSTQWLPISFVNSGVDQNAWSLQLPLESAGQSLTIILVDDQNGMMADWIFQDVIPQNLIADGSFEDKRLLDALDGGPNQFLDAPAQNTWKAALSEGSQCLPYLEIQNKFTAPDEVGAAEGTQWSELDSLCILNDFSKGNSISLYQDLKLQSGHYYSISFSYKRREGAPASNPQQLNVKFGGESILERTTTEGDWTRFEVIKRVASSDVRLEFKDTGNDLDGKGTLLDAVQVMDLGDGTVSN